MVYEGKQIKIVALRNEKGSYNNKIIDRPFFYIVALRNEKGSYNNGNAQMLRM